MVNSKKMSKSSVAVIVLAILLVLSMVLGLTGAWYYQKSGATTEGDFSFDLRDDWITLTASGEGSVTVKRSVAGGEEYELQATEGTYTVMPGDVITSSGSVSFAVTNTGKVGFFYIIAKDGVAFGLDEIGKANHVAAGEGSDEAIAVADTLDLADNDQILEGGSGSWTVKTSLTQDDKAKSAEISFGSYAIYACQDENMDAAEAYTYLLTLIV